MNRFWKMKQLRLSLHSRCARKLITMKTIHLLWLLAVLSLLAPDTGSAGADSKVGTDKPWTDEAINAAWTGGRTLPWRAAKRFPIASLKLKNDTGMNVLVDLAHQCSFNMMWQLPRKLHQAGFRACGSQASLHTVLARDGYSRARIPYAPGIEPFAWIPNPEFNVVITQQRSLESQRYLPEEIAALKTFVEQGGGLIIMGTRPPTAAAAAGWSLNDLAGTFGATYTSQRSGFDRHSAALDLSPEWDVMEQGDNGPARARRTFGQGRVVLLENSDAVSYDSRKDPAEVQNTKQAFIKEVLTWAAQGKPPVRDEGRLPQARGGGGGIYPELEQQLHGIVVYYAANQTQPLLDTVRNDLPKVTTKLDNWLPSIQPPEPMYLVLSSGGGGGWAVNVRKPRENGIISLKPAGVISIFGHELAHTMAGPPNADGRIAGNSPHHNQGESHAGWFQGKVNAVFDETLRDQPNRNCNGILAREEKAGARIDLTRYNAATWGKGANWQKEWFLFQKLDDRYGPRWYPRWRWVQHTRWKDDPRHDLTWDEMVEDMSIAVGEDLFPFFDQAGLSLKKQRLETIEFQGAMMTLPVAPIDYTPAGPVRIEEIGDPRMPITLGSPES
jgi:hypothetical protein